MPSFISQWKLLPPCFAALLLLGACGGGDTKPPIPVPTPANNDIPAGPVDQGTGADNVGNGRYRIELSATEFNIIEGGNPVGFTLSVVRIDGHSAPISLDITSASDDDRNVQFTIFDDEITGAETNTEVNISLGVARAPIQAQTRELTVVANDNETSVLEATLTLNVTPTSAPDVYLLIGQSNMVGFSLDDARESEAGGDDAPNDRIMQLNVTGNDQTNFSSPAAFTNPNSIADPNQRLVTALDPLLKEIRIFLRRWVGSQKHPRIR